MVLPTASSHQVRVMTLMSSIRGSAALIVAAIHAFQVFVLPHFGLYGVAHLLTSWVATYAVVSFFIVSGFMIFQSISRHKIADGNFNLIGFLLVRFFRIYPPLIAAVLLSLVVYWLIKSLDLHGATSFRLGGELFLSRERVEFEWDRLLPTLLLLYNVVPSMPPPLSINGPLWTLAYEWWFYLFAGLSSALLSRRSLIRWFLFCGLLILFFMQPSGILFWVFLMVWYAGFFLGYVHSRNLLSSPKFWLIAALTVILCSLCIFFTGKGAPLKYFLEPLQRLGSRAHVTMMFVSFIMTVALAALIRMNYSGRLFVKAASYSYTLYLIHFPLLLLAFSVLHPLVYAAGWGFSSIAGLLSFLVIVFFAKQLAKYVENRIWAIAVSKRIESQF
jgi:peptidoglycan/LPS O-acetylase OafA/YrhL